MAYRAPFQDRLTIEEFERLPDEECRRELVRGRVVREPPAGFDHGRRGIEVGYLLRRSVEKNPVGVVCGAETGFILADAGTRLVWVVDPGSRTLAVHRPGGEARVLGEADELEGGDVLPGLRVRVAEIFAG